MSDQRRRVLCVTLGVAFAIAHLFLSVLALFSAIFGGVATSQGPRLGVLFPMLTFPASIILNLFSNHVSGNDALLFGTMAGNSMLWGLGFGWLCHWLLGMRRAPLALKPRHH